MEVRNVSLQEGLALYSAYRSLLAAEQQYNGGHTNNALLANTILGAVYAQLMSAATADCTVHASLKTIAHSIPWLGILLIAFSLTGWFASVTAAAYFKDRWTSELSSMTVQLQASDRVLPPLDSKKSHQLAGNLASLLTLICFASAWVALLFHQP